MSSEQLPHWERKYFKPGGDDAKIAYIVFGHFEQPLEISMSSYRTAGVPDFIDVTFHARDDDPKLIESYLEDYSGDWLRTNDPSLFATVKICIAAIEVTGTLRDPADLDYMRDLVGILAALADKRGIAILDRTAMRWYRPHEWKELVFGTETLPAEGLVNTIVTKDNTGPGWWVSTRGMRKFGRPDISVRNVPRPNTEAVIDVCNRMAATLAAGAFIEDGKVLRPPTIPGDLVCHLTGGYGDNVFHNHYVEIAFPRQSTTRAKTGPIRQPARA